jgi:two-component system response regulator HydG
MTPMRDAMALLVSSDAPLVETIAAVVRSVPTLQPFVVASPDEALGWLDRARVAIAVIHQSASVEFEAIVGWVREVALRGHAVPTLVVRDEHQAEQALALLRLGVADDLCRPLDLNRLAYLLDVLTVRARRAPEPAPAAPGPDVVRAEIDGEPFLYAPLHRMGRMMEQLRRVAPRDTTILLGGETGTGKTRLARLIHDLSQRHKEPFLTVNCGALSPTLIESEMFGHVRGAFTGADRDRTGKFAEAGRGTLLLDEIDALPAPLQAKLLRAVEERQFEAVGSNRAQTLRARLIAASNRPLDAEVAAGRFRADLFYRLNVITFTLPPLRERREIVAALAETFAAQFAAAAGRPAPRLEPDVRAALDAYPWPGNIRELRNAVERAVALGHGDGIALDDLPDTIARATPRAAEPEPVSPAPRPTPALAPASATLSQVKEQVERARIHEALDRNAQNRLRAAAELGISRWALYKKLYKYGLMS